MSPRPLFEIDDQGCRITHYQSATPFASFLPGVAGVGGCPLWTFYVNRGQGMVSFGVKNRDNMILDFLPADQAYRQVGTVGFRTFISIPTHPLYMPFSVGSPHTQEMVITPHDVQFIERNALLGLTTGVRMCTLPGMPIPALMRAITFSNTSTRPISMTVVDGLPQIMPFGMNEFFCKNMSRTSEAWMGVHIVNNVPFYQLKVLPQDDSEVQTLSKGNFCWAHNGKSAITPLVDPAIIFGSVTSWEYPEHLISNTINSSAQILSGRTPCALAHQDLTIAPGESETLYFVIGQVDSISQLSGLVPTMSPQWFRDREAENKAIISGITDMTKIVTDHPILNAYHAQTVLDNALRGGWPMTISSGNRPEVLYVYGRKHGDLERDYNQFDVSPTPFSQGNGNYRDIHQNRRSDIFINPDLKIDGFLPFFELIQLDGYNPLVISGVTYELSPSDLGELQASYPILNDAQWANRLKSPFTIGDLYPTIIRETRCFSALMDRTIRHVNASHHEGYWTDHWTYNLDMWDAIMGIYPDLEASFLSIPVRFFASQYRVLPRSERYVEKDGRWTQARFLETGEIDPIHSGSWVRYGDSNADLTISILAKWVLLLTIKAATLDSLGSGIEMEAGKPNWYDAINGLPAMFGSTTTEAYEVVRLARMITQWCERFSDQTIELPHELAVFVTEILSLVKKNVSPLVWWHESNTAKESYRNRITRQISGPLVKISLSDIHCLALGIEARVMVAVSEAVDPISGVPLTYRAFTLDSWENQTAVFSSRNLPLFLEGPVHAVRVVASNGVQNIVHAVHESSLMDPIVGVPKVNASLDMEPVTVGRTKVFTPGWLENESIWLHMAYKWLLALLKSKQYDDFSLMMKKTVVAFHPPERYGRSTLENVSFICSSVHPDTALHGRGFVARLSGSTAEWMEIWRTMWIGNQPFFMNDAKELCLRFSPVIPKWAWTTVDQVVNFSHPNGPISVRVKAESVATVFLGQIPVIIETENRENAWLLAVQQIIVTEIDGTETQYMGDTIVGADRIRARDVKKIAVIMG